jgi:hypothetical protein
MGNLTRLLPGLQLGVLLLFISSCTENTVNTPSLDLVSSVPESPIVAIDDNDIAGIVISANGPEAGVWVIAETGEFDTFYARIVVTDDQGRYLIPDLPDANYQVWVRGYGLIDSPKAQSQPGSIVDIAATPAATELDAAEVYPAAYWYSMMGLPSDEELEQIDGLNAYLSWMKNMGCIGCHQLGNKATRTIPESLGEFETHEQAWIRRVSSGQTGGNMLGQLTGRLASLPFKYLADWTERVAAGETPANTPERPSGLERNVVVTGRDWSDPKAYMHDLSGTDRRDPTVNSYGPLYGAPELSTDEFPVLFPPEQNVSCNQRTCEGRRHTKYR